MLRLYKFIEVNLPSGVYDTVTYDNMDEDIKGAVCISNYGSKDPERSFSGVSSYSIKMQVTVNRRDGEAGLQECSDFLYQFIDNVERKKNKVDGLRVVKAQVSGTPVRLIRLNDYNVSEYETVIDLEYKFV